jgi:hypothetical protein
VRSARPGALASWAPLEGTRGEILAVRDSFEKKFRGGKVTLLREDDATEAALRSEAPRHRYLHLATHGFFAPAELRSALGPAAEKGERGGTGLLDREGVVGFHPGLLSGLVLAGANQPADPARDDGILTGRGARRRSSGRPLSSAATGAEAGASWQHGSDLRILSPGDALPAGVAKPFGTSHAGTAPPSPAR